MARLKYLIDNYDNVIKSGIRLILIQICEAHSDLWKAGLDIKPQIDINDRITRANEFIKDYNIKYEVYVDTWNNEYEQTFQSWPDKFYQIDNNRSIILKSTYGKNKNALIDYDYSDLMNDIIKSK